MKTSAVDKGRRSVDVMRGNVDAAAARSFSWVEELTNDTGADILEGSVVVVLADGTIALADTENDPRPTGVVVDQIDDGDTGQVVFGGPVDMVLTTGSVTAGTYGQTSTTPGQAQTAGSPAKAFCEFTDTGTDPPAFLWGGRGGGGTIGGLVIEDFDTAETDTALVLHPDGTGGIEWGVDATGSGSLPWFNVMDPTYGAVGDGTTDDSAAVQDAVDAAAAACGVLYIPAGSYLIGTTVTIDPHTPVLGDGRDCTHILAGADSINVFELTGTAAESAYEANAGASITGLDFDGNGHTGCIGLSWIGVDYQAVTRCNFRNFTGNGTTGGIGQSYYGSLQGVTHDCKFVDNTTGIRYEPASIGYWGGTLPPSRVLVSWSTFYRNASHCIDFSGGSGILLEDCEMGDNGTDGDAATSAIKVTQALDDEGFGLVGRGLWLEANHGGAVIALGGASIGRHTLSNVWMTYNDADYSITVDGSTAAQTLVAENVRHDAYLVVPTVSTWRSVGGTTYLDVTECNGSLSGTWTAVKQSPLLSGQLVEDLSAWLALRLPNLTTTERDAIVSPTAGMLIWNTTTTAVNRYTGSAWGAISGVAALDDLSDVVITSAANGDRLRFDGSNWVNSTLTWELMVDYTGLVMLDSAGNPMRSEVAY